MAQALIFSAVSVCHGGVCVFRSTGGRGANIQTLAHGCPEKKWDIILLMRLWLVRHDSGVAAVQIGEWFPESRKSAGLLTPLLELGKEDSAWGHLPSDSHTCVYSSSTLFRP